MIRWVSLTCRMPWIIFTHVTSRIYAWLLQCFLWCSSLLDTTGGWKRNNPSTASACTCPNILSSSYWRAESGCVFALLWLIQRRPLATLCCQFGGLLLLATVYLSSHGLVGPFSSPTLGPQGKNEIRKRLFYCNYLLFKVPSFFFFYMRLSVQ